MMDPAELQELESLGEAPGEGISPPLKRRSGTAVLTAQGVLCVLALVALVGVKLLAPETFEEVSRWYRRESVRQIALPEWFPSAAQAEESPAPSPVPTAAPTPGPGALQQI